MTSCDFENLDDARKLVRDLRQKTRTQAQQIMAWRRAYKLQEMLVTRLQKEKCEQLKVLSSKLLLLESRLIRKQKDIAAMLNVRETIICRQQRIIETLTTRLTDNGLEVPHEITELENCLPDLDSLNDSDSAVVLEDVDSDSTVYHPIKLRPSTRDGITVVRSISDAIDPNLKYTSMRRNNCFLRRPEILETVYSVEEDADDNQNEKTEANKRRESFATRGKSNCNIDSGDENVAKQKARLPNWSCQNGDDTTSDSENQDNHKPNASPVRTYNRVMLNHRSVTKPKDVKYKRINKAKSKSLEELRGRLKNWVEQGSKIPGVTLEHSQSYA
ncbi:uncharacterized protein LOC132700334 isoform X2 [Cylas formicarius]|nr:uncharacterized protein LOC132700334 isoform X2 [Cylas formicarius]XP_060523549.1 uncharacterized protein LOC132700334 isoform X2 [Cylas formicarius]XP_060523550.1 uncharacterized protein LOC132700334 isoform X2 [Cylas formicarius]XP_060523551.1 uncharacterized protein LOC132700334 isoform X2 [Cylas formicarius]